MTDGTLLGNSRRRAHCRGCGETFSGVSAFDRHQSGYDPVVCRDPGTVGLERQPSGVWGWPAPESRVEVPHWRRDERSEAI